MPRIRTIKPIFWDDDRINNTPLPALLLFIGMKNFCDDKGIIPANDKLIKAKVFPQRDDVRLKDVSQWITDLKENSLLVPLSYDGKGYYALDFSEEKIDKPQPSILPDDALQECSRIFLPQQNFSGTFENVPAGEEEDKERNGIGKDVCAPAVPDRPKKIETVKSEKKSGKPQDLEEVKVFFRAAVGDPKNPRSWPEDKCAFEAAKFFDNYEANGWVQGKKQKPIVDWKAAARNWIRNELEGAFNGNRAPPAARTPAVHQPLPASTSPPLGDRMAKELQYFFERYLENKCTIKSLDVSHYDYLKKRGILSFSKHAADRIRKQAIAENQEAETNEELRTRLMKKFGVLEFFEQMKQKGKEVWNEKVE